MDRIRVLDNSKSGPNVRTGHCGSNTGPEFELDRHFYLKSGPVIEWTKGRSAFIVVRFILSGIQVVRLSSARFFLKVGLRIPDLSGIQAPTVFVQFSNGC